MADYALQFDGTQNYVNIGTNPSSAVNNFTIAAWINPVIPQTTGMILFNGDDGAGWGIGAGAINDASGTKLIGLFSGVGWVDPGVTLKNNVQQHVALVRRSGTAFLYVNGNETASITTAPSAPNAQCTIGCELNSGGTSTRFFKGIIDNPHIYDRALSASEINNLYNNSEPSKTNLDTQWLFNEGKGTTTADISGNGDTGTLIGTPGPNWVAGFTNYPPGWGISNNQGLVFKYQHLGTAAGTQNINYTSPTLINFLQFNNLALGTVVLYDSVGTSANVIGSIAITSLPGSASIISPMFQNLITKNGLTIANSAGLDLTISYLP